MAEQAASGEVDRSREIERVCDYASDAFKIRIAQVEVLRNRALVTLGMLSGAAAVLSATGAVERLQPVIWLPGGMFGLSLVLALPPLFSVTLMHPVDLQELRDKFDDFGPGEIDDAVFENTATADRLAQRLASATASYTNWSLRFAVMGMTTFVLPILAPNMSIRGAAATSVACGVFMLGLIEMSRRAIGLASSHT